MVATSLRGRGAEAVIAPEKEGGNTLGQECRSRVSVKLLVSSATRMKTVGKEVEG